jgi:multidrug resistance efflux pump
MDELEGTTLELIHRRRIRSSAPRFGVLCLVTGMVVALPLIKVDIVSTCHGMIRPREEPVEISSPMTGIVDSAILKDHLRVVPGDTLVWIRRDLQETRIREYQALAGENMRPIRDIAAILGGKPPALTAKYRQSYRNQLATERHLRLQRDFLESEFHACEKLFLQDVIPVCEYEQSRSDYMVSHAKLEDQRETYRSILENELYRLETENRHYLGEIEKIRATLQNYYMVAPAAGILQQCSGITEGSVVQQGERLGTISPSGRVVAECYVETRDISTLEPGTRVRLRLDGQSHDAGSFLDTEVTQIDPDVVVVNGRPVYRTRCLLDKPTLETATGEIVPVIVGMTFTASMILHRRSLASLVVEKITRWANPSIPDHSRRKGHEEGS